MGPTGYRTCTCCHATKAVSAFRLRPNGKPYTWCRVCMNRDDTERRALVTERPTPAQELERLRARIQPSPDEWNVVQQAATRVDDYLRAKAFGAERYTGETAWAVIEAATGSDAVRFHQLMSLAVVQQHAWEELAARRIAGSGPAVTEDMVRRIRSMKGVGRSARSIAAEVGVSQSSVYKILEGLTHRNVSEDAPPPTAAVPAEAA